MVEGWRHLQDAERPLRERLALWLDATGARGAPRPIGLQEDLAEAIAMVDAVGRACECFYMMPALNGVPEHFGRSATVEEVRAECSAAIDECLSILEPLIGRRP